MIDARKKDHWSHFIAYLVAGAFLGGALDIFVFRVGTPLYGVMSGAVIAAVYIGAISARRRL